MRLSADVRNIFGKRLNASRVAGLVPAELYGFEVKNLHLFVTLKELKKALKEVGENSVIDLQVKGDGKEATHPVLIQGLQKHPVSDELIGVDFYEVDMKKETEANIPVELVGEAPAVKLHAGILVKVLQEIEVRALPINLPSKILVNLSSLTEINQSLMVKDLDLSQFAGKNVKILTEPDSTIVIVKAQMTEEEEAALVAANSTGVDAVKVEAEEKKKAEEANAAVSAEAPAKK